VERRIKTNELIHNALIRNAREDINQRTYALWLMPKEQCSFTRWTICGIYAVPAITVPNKPII
jgi:hypothetical protein